MAELDTSSSGGGKHKGGKRAKKMSTRVDLTAMVDLGFLLITFFMLTTTFNKPKTMELNMPDKDKDTKEKDQTQVPASRTLTLILASGDSILWFNGVGNEPGAKAELTDYSEKGVRSLLLRRLGEVKTATPDKDLIVLIKPMEKSKYKNTVDILDEIAITDTQIYAIVDIDPLTKKLAAEAGAK